MAKSREKIQSRRLRQAGHSIKEIAHKLSVSPGSVSVWCRDIELSSKQIEALEARMTDPNYGKRATYIQHLKKSTDERIRKLKSEGAREVGLLTYRELFVAGVALYWAEGFKRDKQIGFANTDPKMIVFFLYWLENCLGVEIGNIRLRITINESYIAQVDRIEHYWGLITGIPKSQFQKPILQKVSWKKEYENKLTYNGVLRIRVNKSLKQLRTLLGMIDGLHYGITERSDRKYAPNLV